MNNLNEKHLQRLIHPAILDRFRPISAKDDVYTSSLSCQETLPFFLFWPKRLFLRTFNERGRKNQSKSIHKCFTVIVSNGPTVRQFDSLIVRPFCIKIDKKENYIYTVDLCCLNHFVQYIYFNVSSLNLKGNKRNLEIQRTLYLCCLQELSDWRSDPASNHGTESAYSASSLAKRRDACAFYAINLIFHVRFFLLKYNI